MSAKLKTFARLLDLFAEDSKFTSNESDAAKENSRVTKSDTKNGAVAKKSNSKVTSSSRWIGPALLLCGCGHKI